MTERICIDNVAGGYSYVSALGFASAGTAAFPGMAIDHVVLAELAPLAVGFDFVERCLESCGRPISALCGIELRSPSVVGLEEFLDFNEGYLAQLDSWGLLIDGDSPLTRTNVVPGVNPPKRPSLLAFSFTTEEDHAAPTFVLSGVAELPEGAHYPQEILHRGETSPTALTANAVWVAEQLSAIAQSLGVAWDDATSVHLYTQHPDIFAIKRNALGTLDIKPNYGLIWHDASPPIRELELEIDIRRYGKEIVVVDI